MRSPGSYEQSFLFPIGYGDVDQLHLCGRTSATARYSGAHLRCPKIGSRALPQCALMRRIRGFLKQSEDRSLDHVMDVARTAQIVLIMLSPTLAIGAAIYGARV